MATTAFSGFQVAATPTAFHLWLELPQPWRADAFRAEAERQGVLLVTGEAFIAGRELAPHPLRICIGGSKSIPNIKRGLDIITKLLVERPDSGFNLA